MPVSQDNDTIIGIVRVRFSTDNDTKVKAKDGTMQYARGKYLATLTNVEGDTCVLMRGQHPLGYKNENSFNKMVPDLMAATTLDELMPAAQAAGVDGWKTLEDLLAEEGWCIYAKPTPKPKQGKGDASFLTLLMGGKSEDVSESEESESEESESEDVSEEVIATIAPELKVTPEPKPEPVVAEAAKDVRAADDRYEAMKAAMTHARKLDMSPREMAIFVKELMA